ncbi:MAG: amidase [Holophagales bacterium]|nr:amidase [Holophagales bacterium]MYF95622.1 amidase [Holophagales bacterium]
MHLDRLSLIQLLDLLSAGELSCVELMDATLERVEATHPKLNAVVSQRPRGELLADAEAADARRAAGDARPLEGVPLGVKDLEDVAGMVTSMGSRVFRDSVAEADSTQVTRLRDAGAIVVGKTNTPEFGFTAITKNPLFGVTRSPWNLERTPGGSSGGSSAVLAGGVLPLVTSSDGGGSIRIPASFTGAFGLKPSQGRIPRGPMKAWDYGSTAVYGPLTRTVEDGALFLDLVAGPSPCDPGSLPHPGLSYREVLESGLPSSVRIAWSPDLGYARVQSDVARVAADAAAVFDQSGLPVEPVEEQVPAGPPMLTAAWGTLGNFLIAGQIHEPLRNQRQDMTHSFAEALERSWEMTPETFGAAARERGRLNQWCGDVFDRFDLLLTPTVPYDPPPARGPFPTHTEGREQVPAGVAAFTVPFNMSGHPAATVRAGFSDAGLPVGLQIVGPRHRDDLVLRAARLFERARPWHPNWPEV